MWTNFHSFGILFSILNFYSTFYVTFSLNQIDFISENDKTDIKIVVKINDQEKIITHDIYV